MGVEKGMTLNLADIVNMLIQIVPFIIIMAIIPMIIRLISGAFTQI